MPATVPAGSPVSSPASATLTNTRAPSSSPPIEKVPVTLKGRLSVEGTPEESAPPDFLTARSVMASPFFTPSFSATFFPSTAEREPGVSDSRDPGVMNSRSPKVLPVVEGSMPLALTALNLRPFPAMASASVKTEAPLMPCPSRSLFI